MRALGPALLIKITLLLMDRGGMSKSQHRQSFLSTTIPQHYMYTIDNLEVIELYMCNIQLQSSQRLDFDPKMTNSERYRHCLLYLVPEKRMYLTRKQKEPNISL